MGKRARVRGDGVYRVSNGKLLDMLLACIVLCVQRIVCVYASPFGNTVWSTIDGFTLEAENAWRARYSQKMASCWAYASRHNARMISHAY